MSRNYNSWNKSSDKWKFHNGQQTPVGVCKIYEGVISTAQFDLIASL